MNRVEFYRAHIIRGKAAKDLENLLPAYTSFIEEITPCYQSAFKELFNEYLRKVLVRETPDVKEKTLDNHRTEIAKKLFALYYTSKDGVVRMSERARSFVQLDDSVQFFKDLCFKSQFPNATVKKQTYQQWMDEKLSIRYYCYLVRFLQVAEENGVYLNYRQLGYYVLNNKHALTRKYSPEEIFEQVLYDKARGGIREVTIPAGKESSYAYQHLREMCSLLVLSGIIQMESEHELSDVRLNHAEEPSIMLFAAHWNDEPLFAMDSYQLSSPEESKIMERDWERYYSEPSSEFDFFKSCISIPEIEEEDKKPEENQTGGNSKPKNDTKLIGEIGENIVYLLEKRRVASEFRFRNDVRRIKNHGAETGYGYDISSVAANIESDTPLEERDSIYIEVKTTRRALSQENPYTSFKFTKNEYLAAKQFKNHYFIFHVILYGNNGCSIYRIQNPIENRNVDFIPVAYDVDVNLGAFVSMNYSQETIDELR